MSCPCNPRTGKPFCPEDEGPSEADLARFGGDEYDPREDDDPVFGQEARGGWSSKRTAVVVGVGGFAAILALLAFSGLLSL